MVIEELDMVVQESGNVVRMVQVEIQIQFFLDPAVEGLHNWIICGRPPWRHGAQYTIIMIGLTKNLEE